ncbi:unnamed protein product [Clonostachys rhizophaga]|uniref:Uncharacterized protein n=1 Tax=Clonostachys rhizophaga TaxID=160324 RepID=A0A9N9VHW3_9HYPO|nr:unnamed protein product [Clonostachys rhizophaga]
MIIETRYKGPPARIKGNPTAFFVNPIIVVQFALLFSSHLIISFNSVAMSSCLGVLHPAAIHTHASPSFQSFVSSSSSRKSRPVLKRAIHRTIRDLFAQLAFASHLFML